MEDERIWASEKGLWTASPERYRQAVHNDCLMVLPSAPFIVRGSSAADEVSRTPRLSKVSLSNQQVSRPAEGLIVVAYEVDAEGDGRFKARCTSTYHRLAHDDWQVVQHQQTPIID